MSNGIMPYRIVRIVSIITLYLDFRWGSGEGKKRKEGLTQNHHAAWGWEAAVKSILYFLS